MKLHIYSPFNVSYTCNISTLKLKLSQKEVFYCVEFTPEKGLYWKKQSRSLLLSNGTQCNRKVTHRLLNRILRTLTRFIFIRADF